MADTLKVPRTTIDAFKDAMGLDLRLTRAVNIYPNSVLVERIAVDDTGEPIIENGEAGTVQDIYTIEEPTNEPA